jgi:IclR family KDG regulon transcriptional repressor
VADANRLSTLANGLGALEHLVAGAMTMRELAAACGLPRQTTYRIVATLIDQGWVDRTGETYRASPRMWSLAAQSFSFSDLRDAHAGTVRRLAQEHGESVHLAVLDRATVVYVDKADGSNPVGSYTTLGGRAPASCVATGKLLLAHADPVVLDQVVAAGLEQHSPLSIDSPGALRVELERVRAHGFAVNRGEWRLGVGGVAVAVRNPFNEVVAALGFSGPSDRILARLDELVLALHEATGADLETAGALR